MTDQQNASILTRAATDAQFRQRLIGDPAGSLREMNMAVPADVSVRVVQAAADRVVLVLPPAVKPGGELGDEEVQGIDGAGGVWFGSAVVSCAVGAGFWLARRIS